jgi:dynein heavy chain
MSIVSDVDALVKKMKENIRKAEKMMEHWEKPLFDRKPKPFAPEDVEQIHQALVISRLEDVRNHGKEIHKLLKDTFEHIKPDKKSPTWVSYVDYVNSLVIKGITEGICASMGYLADQISIPYNKHHQLLPIFDIRVDLQDRDVIFDPPINYTTKGNSIRDIIQKIIDDFVSLAIQMPRLDTNSGDYLPEVKDQFAIFGATNHVSKQF